MKGKTLLLVVICLCHLLDSSLHSFHITLYYFLIEKKQTKLYIHRVIISVRSIHVMKSMCNALRVSNGRHCDGRCAHVTVTVLPSLP